MLRETLLILLPRAIDYGDGVVGSREYHLSLFTHIANYYTTLGVRGVRVIPNFAPVQLWLYRNDVELGRYASQNGMIDLDIEGSPETPLQMRLYNLSIDTEVTLSIMCEGGLHNAIQG